MPSLLRAVVFLVLLSAGLVFGAAPTIDSGPTAVAGGTDGAEVLSVNASGNGGVTTVTFSYGLTVAYGSTATTAQVGAAESNVVRSVTLTGLIGGQTYHYKVTLTNPDGTVESADQTFVVAAYAPTLTLVLPPLHAGGVETVRARVTANGSTGTVFFEYGPTATYGSTGGTMALAASDVDKAVSFVLPAPLIYHYRFSYDDGSGGAPEKFTLDALSNFAPVAVDDSVRLATIEPVTIRVLANDSDANVPPEADDDPKITFVSAPKNGSVTFTDSEIEYTPGPNFTASTVDTFNYTIDDDYGGIATAKVTVRSLTGSLVGIHGGLIKKSNGREVGYFTLATTRDGSFTGIAIIDGERYVLKGVLSADDTFTGSAVGDNGTIPVRLSTKNEDAGAVITATFNNGQYTADLNVSETEAATRAELRRRYTAEIGAGGSGPTNGNDPGTPPEGSGWLAARVRDDGTASIKGRLSDGRSFSTRGTVNIVDGVATLTFYDDLEATRFIGNLTLGDTVGGTVRTDRDSSGDGLYPRGYDITQTVDGARYLPPAKDKRVLDTVLSKGQDLTISFSGGTLTGTLTRDLYLDDHDKVKVLNRGADELKVTIDRRSGRFQAKVTIDNEGKRIKATGVLIQATDDGPGGRGLGTFNTSAGTGTVTISATGSGSDTPTPTPNP